MKKIILLFTSLSLIGFQVTGQDYAFKVLANKGGNEIKVSDGWQPIKTGASLTSNDEIKIGPNAYLALVHNNGMPKELKAPGNYLVKNLSKELESGEGGSVLNKYTDFILSSNTAEGKKNRLTATGAVHRGDSKFAINVLLPRPMEAPEIFSNKVILKWESNEVKGPYILSFKDDFLEEFFSVETTETEYDLDLSIKNLANHPNFSIFISSKNDPSQTSNQYLIKKMNTKDVEAITTDLHEVQANLERESALTQYILAVFFEEKGLTIDALTAFEEAVRLAPDVPTYQESLEEFLLRHELK